MKVLRFLFSRMVIVGLMIVVQFVVFLFFLMKFSHYSALVSLYRYYNKCISSTLDYK